MCLSDFVVRINVCGLRVAQARAAESVYLKAFCGGGLTVEQRASEVTLLSRGIKCSLSTLK